MKHFPFAYGRVRQIPCTRRRYLNSGDTRETALNGLRWNKPAYLWEKESPPSEFRIRTSKHVAIYRAAHELNCSALYFASIS